jgi:hypothetical protein
MRVVVEKLFLSQVLDTGDETLYGGIIHGYTGIVKKIK